MFSPYLQSQITYLGLDVKFPVNLAIIETLVEFQAFRVKDAQDSLNIQITEQMSKIL